jgi:hypothetical protein
VASYFSQSLDSVNSSLLILVSELLFLALLPEIVNIVLYHESKNNRVSGFEQKLSTFRLYANFTTLTSTEKLYLERLIISNFQVLLTV